MIPAQELNFVIQAWNAWTLMADNQQIKSLNTPNPSYSGFGQSYAPLTLPKLLQRRLSPIAKAVFNVAFRCLDTDEKLAIVFSTSHGEVNKTLGMLIGMVGGEGISPTAFSLSVHNAISGLFSIASQNHQEISVLAPGQDGIAPAFLEALGVLQEQAIANQSQNPQTNSVLMVFYDEPLADFYPRLPDSLKAQGSCALAIKIALTGVGLPMTLASSSTQANAGEHALQTFAFLDFLQSDTKSLQLGNHRHSWVWQKK
jgi:hypothetical protein